MVVLIVMESIYTLEELSTLLKFQPSYVRMVIRKFLPDFKENDLIDNDTAQKVAEKLKRSIDKK